MKQIDNRQKQQIVMRAQKAGLGGRNPVRKMEGHAKKEFAPPVPPAEENEGQKAPAEEAVAEAVHRSQPKIGRNDPCLCGSGKKYKKCCLPGKGIV